MVYLRVGLFLMVMLKSVLPGMAQYPFFKVHHMEERYSNLQVGQIYEDQKSMLWLGSEDGLFQYNGKDFIPFLKNDGSSEKVSAIFHDRQQRLWVGYEDGSIAHFVNQELQLWPLAKERIRTTIRGIVQDAAGAIWIATYGQGVFVFQDDEFVHVSINEGLLSEDVYVMLADAENNVWVGTDGGINRFYFTEGKLQSQSIRKKEGLPDEIVKELLLDQQGNLWIGMFDQGICYYDVKRQTFFYPEEAFAGGEVTSLLLFGQQELWIGTENKSVWRYDLSRKAFSPILDNTKQLGTKIYDLLVDAEGNAWVLSNERGIAQANRQFEFLPTNFNNIQALIFDRQQQLWLGTQEGLFRTDRVDKQLFYPVDKTKTLNVLSLYEDEFGVIWIGTFGEGVYCYEPQSGEWKRFVEEDGLSNNSVVSIDGKNGRVWLATLGGVTEVELSQSIFEIEDPLFKRFNQESGLGTNYIYQVFIDSKDRVWFASDGKGVSVLVDGVFTNYNFALVKTSQNSTQQIPLKTVYSITEDLQGKIWLSTADQGIFEFDGQSFQQLTLKEGIRDLEISSLVRDKKGNILIVHPSGIDLLDPMTHHLIYYEKEVGISNINANLNAVCQDHKDNLWIAGQHQLIQYTPLDIPLEIHPRTFINKVSIFLDPIDFRQQNIFAYHQNNLVFDYVGVWYTDPGTVKYRYQLAGYDHDWIFSSDSRATYSNLPPGSYSFKVMSTENDAFSHEPIATFDFKILNPIWKRWWFLLLAFLGTILLFRWYQKTRDHRLQKVNLLKKESVESQLEAIKAQMNPHFLFNSFNTLIAIIEEDRELAVEYVEHLSDFYRSILQYRDKEVILIQEELQIIKNYSFLIKKRFGDNFNLDINLNGEPIYIAPFTLQVLVENAIKHNIISKNQPLHISIGIEHLNHIVVRNNLQKKIVKPESTSFGLASIAKRYELMIDKKILIEETDKDFTVRIPVIK